MKKILDLISNLANKTWIQFFVFSGLLWLVFVYLHINRHIEDMIVGPHYWRKSDTYSQIMNYYYNGLNFFDHSYYFNQMDSNGKAVGEFPLFYYLIAIQLKLLGNYPLIIKINWVILLFLGQFSIFKITHYFIKSFWISCIVPFTLFLSPLFTFYCLAYLTDPIALNLILIGLLFLLKHHQHSKHYFLWMAIFFISWSGMTKPFFMVPYFALLITILINQFLIKSESIPKFKWHYLIPIAFLSIWYYYTQWYNSAVGCDCFLSEIRPIWNETPDSITAIWKAITQTWLPDYIHPKLLWLLGVLVIINTIWWTTKTIFVNIFHLLVVLGSLFYFLLFFNMFQYHDYYIFPILLIIPTSIAIFIYKLISISQSLYLKFGLSIVVILLFFISLNYSWVKSESRRNTSWMNSISLFENYQNLEHFLVKNSIHKNDLVLTLSDKSPSFALSLINRKGWSGFQTKPREKKISQLLDSGLSYLILNKNAPFSGHDSIICDGYLDYPIDDTNNIYLYDLKPYKIND